MTTKNVRNNVRNIIYRSVCYIVFLDLYRTPHPSRLKDINHVKINEFTIILYYLVTLRYVYYVIPNILR